MHLDVAAPLAGAAAAAGTIAWLAFLWYAAPLVPRLLRRPASGGVADRLRDTAALGIAISLVLGLCHLSWGPLLLAAAAAAAIVRWATDDGSAAYSDRAEPWLALPLGLVAIFALAALPRPPLDGDTLGYHLPNVLAWTRAGSLWETGNRYWWYPGGSEAFAAGAAALGPIAIGLCGTLAAAMATSRVYVWCRYFGVEQAAAALVGALFATVPMIALQSGNLQNDVWLAAFFLESLWLLQLRSPLPGVALALMALIKPVGVVYALLALAAYALPNIRAVDWRALWWWPMPLLVWAARDALLWHGAVVPPSTTYVPLWPTTVLAHGGDGFAAFGSALYLAGPGAAILIACAILGPIFCTSRQAAVAGLGAALLFLILPFGFDASTPQLANGASLRFLAPAIAVGAVAFGSLAAGRSWLTGAAAACTLAGAIDGLRAFWADGATWAAAPLASALGIAWAAGGAWRRAASIAACVVVVCAGAFASARALNMLDTVIFREPTVVFAWLRTHALPRMVAVDVRAGALELAAQRSLADDGLDADPCAQARRRTALLVLGTDPDVPPALHRQRVAAARACGAVLYEDGVALVVAPR